MTKLFHSRAIGSRQGSPSHDADLNKNSNKDDSNPQVSNQPPPISIDSNFSTGPVLMDQHNFGGPPGLSNDHQPLIPPFHAGGDGGLHMLGGPNGGPPGGPSPPMQTPMLGGPLGSGIDGMMDLQQVGPLIFAFFLIVAKFAFRISQHTLCYLFLITSKAIFYCSLSPV